jgi:hypothetical protein
MLNFKNNESTFKMRGKSPTAKKLVGKSPLHTHEDGKVHKTESKMLKYYKKLKKSTKPSNPPIKDPTKFDQPIMRYTKFSKKS